MAAEGFKPGDFYIGVYELFAILLPGAILTYLAWKLGLQCLIEHSRAPLNNLAPGEGAASYLTFAVLSYVVGHFLAAFGWVFMNPVFEAQLREARRNKEAQRNKEVQRNKKSIFPLLPRIEERARLAVPKSANLTEKDEPFEWTLAFIDTHYPAAAAKLEVTEADCKFFRNLIPALLLSLPIIDVAHFTWGSGTKAETILIVLFFVYVLVASFSFRREGVPWISRGITSLPWLFMLLIIPVLTNIVLQMRQQGLRQPFFLIDLGILLTVLLAMARYMLLQSKRMWDAYNYLLAVLSPAPNSA